MRCANTLRGLLGLDGARYLPLTHCQPGYELILHRARSSLLESSIKLCFLGHGGENDGESLQAQEQRGFLCWCIPEAPQAASPARDACSKARASSPSSYTAWQWILARKAPSSLLTRVLQHSPVLCLCTWQCCDGRQHPPAAAARFLRMRVPGERALAGTG